MHIGKRIPPAFFAIGLTVFFVPWLFAPSSNAQIDQPHYVSPRAKAEVSIEGKQITVDYYAPSMHGRKIMDGLVPFGEVWGTGANWATVITIPSAMDIGGLHLAKGSYSIWTIPEAKEWTLIINKQTGQYHLDYNSTQDFGRAKMDVKKLDEPVETFKIELRAKGGPQGTLALMWENTEASIPFTLTDDAK